METKEEKELKEVGFILTPVILAFIEYCVLQELKNQEEECQCGLFLIEREKENMSQIFQETKFLK